MPAHAPVFTPYKMIPAVIDSSFVQYFNTQENLENSSLINANPPKM